MSPPRIKFYVSIGLVALAIAAWSFLRSRVVLGDYVLGRSLVIAPEGREYPAASHRDDDLALAIANGTLERLKDADPGLARINSRDKRYEITIVPLSNGKRLLHYSFLGYSAVHWDWPTWGFMHDLPDREEIRELNGVVEQAIGEELRDTGWEQVRD